MSPFKMAEFRLATLGGKVEKDRSVLHMSGDKF
jgi:hypothetical protein